MTTAGETLKMLVIKIRATDVMPIEVATKNSNF